jgi:predicted DNA-binding transcriptional regulator YafY
MRADRLLSILLILQTKGRQTARELATDLEVSERTIYRDFDALSSAGVPVYAERGPGGGCFLLESYRTELTGLTQDEVSAFFMLSIPTPLVELGLDQDLKSALLKLSAALPDILRRDGINSHERIHLDPSSWFQLEIPTTHLSTIQRGLKVDCQIEMTYQLPFGAQINQLVEPFGLVAKDNEWYFIFSGDENVGVVRLSNILEVKLTDVKFHMPDRFKLVEFWQAWCLQRENNRPVFEAKVRIKSDLLEILRLFRAPVLQGAQENEQVILDDWRELILRFETFEGARKQLLSFGSAVEVLSPISLRKSIQDFAHQVVKLYKQENSPYNQVS